MDPDHADTAGTLLSHVLVPLAGEEDARETARALSAYGPERVTMLHVVEKGEGVPDKTPVEQSEQVAAAAFAAFRETFPDAEEELAYRRDVVEAIHDKATELDVSAIAFVPRSAGRIVRFLSGDMSLQLVTDAERPVIALPGEET